MRNEQAYWDTFLKRHLSRRHFLALIGSAGTGAAILACTGDDDDEAGTGSTASTGTEASDSGEASGSNEETVRPAGWTAVSHSNDVEPDYAVVFPADRVNQMTFTVSPENWQAMLDNLTELMGERGSGGGFGGFGGGQRPNMGAGGPNFGEPPAGQGGMPGGGFGGGGPGGGGFGGGSFTSENPMWVPATVSFNGLEWTHVGLRFKGNSSLRGSWSQGTDKMPFKLDFDEFEDDYPEMKNQRFYGFKQLSLSNNWNDASAMREALTYDVLSESGLVAAETGFSEILLDYGQGVQNLGLYTVIEVIDDTVIGRYFEDDSGNIYEAEGSAASLAAGTEGNIEASFEVESDEALADWNDIRALYDTLHSDLRSSDPDAWRDELESIFEVDSFLEWLAIAAALQHWDTYGGMTHNYYLYNDPSTGRLNWISWDHNLVLGSGGGGGGGAGPGGRGTSFDKSGVGNQWPLISYLLAQPEYEEKYRAYLRELIEGPFETSRFAVQVQKYSDLLAPHADQGDYEQAVQAVLSSAAQQAAAAVAYLNS